MGGHGGYLPVYRMHTELATVVFVLTIPLPKDWSSHFMQVSAQMSHCLRALPEPYFLKQTSASVILGPFLYFSFSIWVIL